MSKRSTQKSSCVTTKCPFHKEIKIPPEVIGHVIGKNGTKINSLHDIPGVSSVMFSNGRLQIQAFSHQALDAVEAAVERIVSFYLLKKNGYVPNFNAVCFCKSVQDPLLTVNKVCFERFSNDIPNLLGGENIPNFSGGDAKSSKTLFCFKSGEFCQDATSAVSERNIYSLSEEFAHRTSRQLILPQWDFAVYRDKIRSCLEPLIFSRHETMRSINLTIRFGKLLFSGDSSTRLREGVFMSVERLQDLCRRRLVDSRLCAACSDSAVEDPGFVVRLQGLGYRRVSSRKKISMQVTDVERGRLLHNVSLRCGGGEDSRESIAITRVRNSRTRHGFVNFCREGSGTTDFRLAVTSNEAEADAVREMSNWIEKAWRNRTPDGILVFDSSGRFLATNIRYEEAVTYLNEGWKFRVAQGGDTDGTKKPSKRLDCVLRSRWFKWNADKLKEDDMDLALQNTEGIVKEAAKLSHLMDAK